MTANIDPAAVETLAAQGLNVGQIALSLDIGRSTLYRLMGSEEEVKAAVDKGRAKGMATMTNALFKMGKGGNFAAAKFYLCNRDPDQWKDRQNIDHNFSSPVTVILHEESIAPGGPLGRPEGPIDGD